MPAVVPPLFPPPVERTLPLTKGRDLSVRFVYKILVVDDDNEPVLLNGKRQFVKADYPDGVTVRLDIDAATPISATAVVDGSDALVHVDHLVVDEIPVKGVPWRLKIIYPGGHDEVGARGKTVRYD